MKPCFFDLDLNDLSEVLKGYGEPDFRTKQLWQLVYKNLKLSPEAFPAVPKELRLKLAENFDFAPVQVLRKVVSQDQRTEKYLFGLQDGKKIEAVLMYYRERITICISTQVGCGMNCAFCATGQMGLTRNLSAGEIAGQVLFFAQELSLTEKKLSNIVIMGMGEPFHNYDNVMKAIDVINHPDGFQFGERRITVSTVGLIPMIEKFTKAKRQINLAISLHAPSNKIREQILPVNRKYPMEQLLEACQAYVQTTRRRITFEYALIHGVNDSVADAAQLAKLLHGMLCHVNLISLNETKKYAGKGSPAERANDFRAVLDRAGIPCSIRLKRGVDIGAGCGQLVTQA